MKRQVLVLLTAAAVSTAAFVGACGAADEQTAETAEPAVESAASPEAAPSADAAPAADAAPTQVAAADEKKDEEAAPAAAEPAAEGEKLVSAIDRVLSSPKGTLKNPYTGDATAIAEGEKVWFGLSCNGCHGGGGGGGMCPPVTNEVWVYGGDDDTLFRLITLGTVDLQKEGYSRKGTEGVVGPMMAYRDLIDDERKLWKLIAWVRTKWGGREERKEW